MNYNYNTSVDKYFSTTEEPDTREESILYIKIRDSDQTYSFDKWTDWTWDKLVTIYNGDKIVGMFHGSLVECVIPLTEEEFEDWMQD